MLTMNNIDRRLWLQSAGMGLCGLSMSGWMPVLASRLADEPTRRRRCVLLWMSGGPSQTDTFDMKPDHENGGEFKEIATSVPGLKFSEHLPKLAAQADKLAIIRSLSTKEGDHGRGTHLMRTGYAPMGAIRYPSLGASLAKSLGSDEAALPRFVSIAPYRAFNRQAFGPGFLGPKYAPLVVGATDVAGSPASSAEQDGFAELQIESIQPPARVKPAQMSRRLDLWNYLQEAFVGQHQGGSARAHQTVYERAIRLMHSDAAKAFDLSEEPDSVREAYGKGLFGQGCLMARRLLERDASFVEVTLGAGAGWDTHANNFDTVKTLSAELDAGWGTLMTDLDERGLLDSTTIIWMGEFGRTPQINGRMGRDHYPKAWTAVLAGGGIAGGQAHGRTSRDGLEVEEDKVGVSEVLATMCAAVGVPPDTENVSSSGRPLPIVDGTPISSLLV